MNTIKLEELRQLANKTGRHRKQAQQALTAAEKLRKTNRLGPIAYDRAQGTFDVQDAANPRSVAATP
jgi:hypothetical protein